MGFLRKHLAWVIVGVALLAELVALWFVMGMQSQAEAAREALEKLRDQRDDLKVRVEGPPPVKERIKALNERRELVRQELGDCALFLWHRGQAIEGLFDAKELAPYDACCWQEPHDFEVFKMAYDRVYQREVKALEPLMDKVGADPAMLGFAERGALAGARVTIGDIFLMQKEFWIKKKFVEILGATDAELLGPIPIAAKTPFIGPRRLPAGKGLVTGPGKLAEELAVQLNFACNYMRFHDLLGALLRSPLCLRVGSVVTVSRHKVAEAPRGALVPAKAPTPKGEPGAKEKGKEGEESAGPARAERKEYVAVNLTTDLHDLAMEVQEVLFPTAAFGNNKDKVAKWLDVQVARAEARLKRFEVSERAKWPEVDQHWVDRELKKLDEPPAPPPGKAPPPPPPAPTVEDELSGEKRQYVFTDLAGAKEWLANRYDFERLKLEAYAELWRRTRAALQAGKADDKTRVGVFTTGEGVAVGFRPANHFDPNQWYEAPFDTGVSDAPVRVKLGLVVFRPETSAEGVRRAVKAGPG